MSATHTKLGSSLSRIGLASERGKIRAGTQTGLQLCRLPVRSEKRQGLPNPRALADPTDKDTGHYAKSSVSGPASDVLDRITDCHRETGTSGPVTYETHTVASQNQLESTRDAGKDHPHSQVTPPTSKMVAGGKQSYQRSTITPTKTCAADQKEGWGAHSNEHMARGNWSLPESKLHINYLELKPVLLALKEFQALCTNNTVLSYRQHYSGCLHKQGRGNEVGSSVCFTMEYSDLVYQETGYSQSSTHPRLS